MCESLSSNLYTSLHFFGLSVCEAGIRVWKKIYKCMEIKGQDLRAEVCVTVPLIF